MVRRLVTASLVSLAVLVSGGVGALTIAGHSASVATSASGSKLANLPGDPCSRNWGEPVETICHL